MLLVIALLAFLIWGLMVIVHELGKFIDEMMPKD